MNRKGRKANVVYEIQGNSGGQDRVVEPQYQRDHLAYSQEQVSQNSARGKYLRCEMWTSDQMKIPGKLMGTMDFKSLYDIVHFYNTRDVTTDETIWPPAEFPDNVNTDELGDLGLTVKEELAIVAFMQTLSDGYTPNE